MGSPVNITYKLGQSDTLFLEIQNEKYALISCKMRKFFVVSMLTCLVFVCKGQKKEEKSLIECYTCGLETEDPELDVAGSYGVRVYSTAQKTDYKMYNESCDLMDRREGQDVPVFIKLSELSKEGVGQKAHLELLSVSSYNLEVGFEIYEKDYNDLRDLVADLPEWKASNVIQSKVKENYNMNYWKKKCDPGVVSCFVAQGEYDSQDPMFRGCAGNYFPHDQKCEFQEQAVTIVEGKKSVDVGVTLCYCNEDLCNEDLSGANINLPNIIIILSVPIHLILTRLENE